MQKNNKGIFLPHFEMYRCQDPARQGIFTNNKKLPFKKCFFLRHAEVYDEKKYGGKKLFLFHGEVFASGMLILK
jgi:hypothetical protein